MNIKRFAPYMLIVVTIIWGSGFTATQAAIDGGLSAYFIMFGRFVIAALTVGIVFHKKLTKYTGKEVGMSLIAGLLLFLSFIVQTKGLEHTTPSKNAFLTATNVVMVPFLYWIFNRRRPGGKAFISAVICFVGICILSVNFGEGLVFQKGDLLSLICALIFAMHMVILGYFVNKMDAIKLIFGQLAGAALFATILFLVVDRDFSVVTQSTSGIMAVVYLGVFSTCICYFLQTLAQQYVTPTKASLILSMESVFGTMFSILLGYETLKLNMVIGGLLILASILFVEIRWKKR